MASLPLSLDARRVESAGPLVAAPPMPSSRPRDRGAVLFGLAALGLFFGGLGGWAALAPLSSAAHAPGQVVVNSHRKTVQHLEGGIVAELLVKEGDEVSEGQLLVRLDDTQAGATLDMLRGQRDALRAQEARLLAERDQRPTITWPSDLETRRVIDPSAAENIAGQTTIFESRRRALAGQYDILEQRIRQLGSEIEGYRAQVSSYAAQSAIAREETRDVQELVGKGLERKARLLQLQREAANLEGNRGQQLGLIAKAEQAIGEAKMQMADLANKRSSEVAADLRDTQSKLADLEEKLRAASDVKARTEVRAPQSGKVVNLRHFTPGGVIKPGEPILEIVPRDDRLIIEGHVQPQDIDGVRAGLPAQVRLMAFKPRRTPTLDGVVSDVSADALTDDRTGQPYYVARIEIPPEQLTRLGNGGELYPGMPTEAMIVTGERTALEYLLDPVRDSFWLSFREK